MSCSSCSDPAAPVVSSPCGSCPVGTMGQKPVFEIDAKTVIDFHSDFAHKQLCDGPTFSLGSICVYSCSFCYVIPMIFKLTAIQAVKRSAALLGKRLEEVIVRRRRGLQVLRRQLTVDRPPGVDLGRKMVIYTSPLVDAAANMVLVKETAEACKMIFELTNWDVRVLSKSSLLPELAKLIPVRFKQRMIYGVSTGTLDDALCKSFEKDTARVSKRIRSLHWLQDHGYRTFGMLCPILPQSDYDQYAEHAVEQIRVDRCEQVWAEVINVRGPSFANTLAALDQGGFQAEAERLRAVCGSGSGQAWDLYARNTFDALARHIGPEQLRFLHYPKLINAGHWVPREAEGAILLGEAFEPFA